MGSSVNALVIEWREVKLGRVPSAIQSVVIEGNMIRTNYIFIDYENVQETELERIANKPVKVMLMLGERHKNLPLILVKKLLRHALQVELVETRVIGKNALDLVLAEHLGEIRSADPHGYFHIVSKDNDFKALIGHLRDKGVLAARYASFGEIPVLMKAAERLRLLANHFQSCPLRCPQKRPRLERLIQSRFGWALTDEELEHTIQDLVREKICSALESGGASDQIPGASKSTLAEVKLLEHFDPDCGQYAAA